MMRAFALTTVGLTLLLVTSAAAKDNAAKVLKKSTTGKVTLRKIDVLTFAPGGVLLVGDGAGAQIFAIDTKDVSPTSKFDSKKPFDRVARKLAEPLGAKADGISIVDMAVNPESGVAYFAVLKQDDKSYAILTLNGNGSVGALDLDNATFARLSLKAGDAKVSLVTDIAWADDRLIAAGRSNEEFASKIFSIDAPFTHDDVTSAFSAETYHVSHRRWETKAPMSVVIPFKEGGKTYVVGAFSCTPIVKYPIDSLKPGAQVKGSSMIELGSGNRPLDMFVYEKKGKPYVLASTFRFHHKRRPFGPSPYWTVKFEQGLLAGDQVDENAVQRLKGAKPATPRIEMVESFHGVKLMDKVGKSHALVLREVDGGDRLELLELP